MKKQFSIPVSFKCESSEQYEKLSKELKKLGYNEYPSYITGWTEYYTHIKTNYNGEEGYYGSSIDTKIEVQSEELFLALASMCSNEEFFEGEYVISQNCLENPNGVILKVKSSDEKLVYFYPNKYKKDYSSPLTQLYINRVRKCNKEEILNHFKINKTEIMQKKLIGYKLKDDCKQFEKAILKIAESSSTFSVFSSYFSKPSGLNGNFEKNLREAGVLDQWFDPIYEDIKKDVQVQVKASKPLIFTISKDYEGYVRENAENNKVSIQSLADMVNHGFELSNYNAYKVIPVTFNMGCIKDIHSSDIIKVVQAYDEFWGTFYYELPF